MEGHLSQTRDFIDSKFTLTPVNVSIIIHTFDLSSEVYSNYYGERPLYALSIPDKGFSYAVHLDNIKFCKPSLNSYVNLFTMTKLDFSIYSSQILTDYIKSNFHETSTFIYDTHSKILYRLMDFYSTTLTSNDIVYYRNAKWIWFHTIRLFVS